MMTNKLIQAIEDHCDQITSKAIDHIKSDPALPDISKLPRNDLEVWGRGILRHAGVWLGEEERRNLSKRYEELGRLRYYEGIPLHECVRALQLLKQETIDFIRAQGFAQSSVEIYAEEELEHRVDGFFDFLLYHLVVGYERAFRTAGRQQVTHA